MSRQPPQEPMDSLLDALASLDAIGLPLAHYARDGNLITASETFKRTLDQQSLSAKALFIDQKELDRMLSALEAEPMVWHSVLWTGKASLHLSARLAPSSAGSGFLVQLLPGPIINRALLQALPVGLALFDSEGRILLLNEALHSLIGFGIDDLNQANDQAFWDALAERSIAPENTLATLRQAASQPEAGQQYLIELDDAASGYLIIRFFQSDRSTWGALFADGSQGHDQAQGQSLLRRGESFGQPLEFNGLVIHQGRRQVLLQDEPIDLTPTEFELLSYLAQRAGQVVTHGQLIEAMWPPGEGNRHSLFVHINRLRGKLETDVKSPRYIVTRWGVGYTFFPAHRSS